MLIDTMRPVARAFEPEAGAVPAVGAPAMTDVDLATSMVLRGAVGALAGAAAGPRGSEGLWGVAGFFMGSTLGQIGIVGILTVALWQKANTR